MKIYYKDYPLLIGNPKNDWLHLENPWVFYIDNQDIKIPAGYEYDGASIPRIFWPIIGSPFEPRLHAPALAHDWLYLVHLTERSVADEALYQLMMQNRVGSIRAHLIWGAVRVFGYLPYQNSEKDKIELEKIFKSNGDEITL